jgi:hypothetical protein
VSAARLVVGALGLLALLVAVATVRQISAGARAVIDSDAAAARGDLAAATARARDAAEAAVPGSPYPREGYARLEAIARAAEAKRDERGAVAAWGAMRAAATATSAPLLGTGAWRALADEGLVRAGSAAPEAWRGEEGATPPPASGEVHASAETLQAALAREDAPPTGLLALLGAGALAFFAGCARLAVAAGDFAAFRRERAALAAATLGAILYAIACFRA